METIPLLPGRGVKRKHEVEDSTRAWQRKSILDMSMDKLRTGSCQRSEPCLRRSVLILNTLKLIENELAQEGVDSHQSTEAAMNEIPEMSVAQLTLDPLPDISTFIYPLPASSPVPMAIEQVPVADSDSSSYLGAGTSVVDLLPCKPLTESQDQGFPQTGHAASVYYDASHLDTSIPQSSCFYYGSTQLNSHTAPSVSPCSEANYTPLSATLPYYPVPFVNSEWELSKVGESGDSNNNMTTPGPYTVGSTSPYEEECLGEAELMDLLHSYLYESAEPLTSTASHPPQPSVSHAPVLNNQCSTYCRSDSALDDFDSIMQILVGI